MHPIGTFTIKSLIVATIVVASMSVFGPQMTRVIAAARFEGEAAFLAAGFEKITPGMSADRAEIAATAKMLR
jgi:hypothetical protein